MSIKEELISKELIPLDKSWIIRMGILDLINNSDQSLTFLNAQKNLGKDIQALKKVLETWNSSDLIEVGESGTLYRFLQFLAWKKGLDKKFLKEGTLENRKTEANPRIIYFPLSELLKLDNNTSQWASAAVLLGNKEKIENPPFKLALTYEALEHWSSQKEKGLPWTPRYDQPILAQALAYIEIRKTTKTSWIPEQAEDYCFARAFNLITETQARLLWPSLAGHESNRFEEMESALKQAEQSQTIKTDDHRVVQALAMLYKTLNKSISFSNPSCVSKSWPQFWDFLKEY